MFQSTPKFDGYGFLPLYIGTYPQNEISMEKFMTLCQNRLNLLREVDVADPEENLDQRTSNLIQKSRQYEIDPTRNLVYKKIILVGQGTKWENDNISHYMLRIAYSKTKELRDWFVKNEAALLRLRIHAMVRLDSQFIPKFLKKLRDSFGKEDFPFDFVDERERRELEQDEDVAEYLATLLYDRANKNKLKDLIKVPFEIMSRFVSKRIGVMKRGFCYIDIDNAQIIIESFFKHKINEAAKQTKRILPYLEEVNEMMAEFLDKIDTLTVGNKDYSKLNVNRKEKINLADLDLHSKRSFPLCMREMHRNLKENHHLKHFGRLQYGLFLKGIGLTLDDSIKFWRTEFTKKMTNDKFERGYVYNIRHSFGKEGKRADYTPWSCARIIQNAAPGASDHHGCPFKEYNDIQLKALLNQYKEFKLSDEDIRDIIEKKKLKQFQTGCKLFFSKIHPGVQNLDDVGIHPNGYFEASLNYYGGDKNKDQKGRQMNRSASKTPVKGAENTA